MFLNGNMYLCARADGAAGRFFSGSVANASFFDEALNASSVAVGCRSSCHLFLMPHGWFDDCLGTMVSFKARAYFQ